MKTVIAVGRRGSGTTELTTAEDAINARFHIEGKEPHEPLNQDECDLLMLDPRENLWTYGDLSTPQLAYLASFW